MYGDNGLMKMASIEKRSTKNGDVSYRAKVRLKGYPIETATFSRRTDAKRWMQQTESRLREGRHFKNAAGKRHNLATAIERYKQNELLKKPKSASAQGQQLQWWAEQIGDCMLTDVSPSLVAECRDKLANGQTVRGKKRSPATVNRYLAALSHLFTTAVKEWGWADDNPLLRVSKQKEPRGRIRYLSEQERSQLLQACRQSNNRYLYLVVLLCLSTGARKMEILALTWNDVDFNRSVITLHETKNGERRLLPLVGQAKDLLLAHSNVRNMQSNLLFPSNYNSGQPIDIRSAWGYALQQSGIENFRFHDLRHSTASYLAMNGASLAEIAEVLGHKTLQMVKRYAHLSEAHTASVVAKMNEKFLTDL